MKIAKRALCVASAWQKFTLTTGEETMPITSTFGTAANFTNVTGYAASVCFTPTMGFQGQYWFYIYDKVDAKQKPTPVSLGPVGAPTVGVLAVNGESRNYNFPDITLQSVEPGATRRERYRTVEFSYPHTPGTSHSIPAVLSNTGTNVLSEGLLGKDYVWGVDTPPQHLLGFQARLSAGASVVVRFASLRNAKNSILGRVVQMNNAQATTADQAMTPWEIKFAQGDLTITKDNLVRLFVQELYGECCKWPIPTLSDYLAPGAGPSLARLNPPAPAADVLLSHEFEKGYDSDNDASRFTVEVCTIVFVPGHYRHLLIG
jgi:hypothetical protein